MEIHKPKPWRGWREFLKEYLIIVVGVLTALAAEQSAEWVRLHNDLQEGREAIRQEVREIAGMANVSIREDRCLLGVADRIDDWARGGPRPGRVDTIFPPFTTTIWDASQTGAVAHMPLKEKFAYAAFYERVRSEQNLTARQISQSIDLTRTVALQNLRADEARALLQDVSAARTVLQTKIVIAKQILDMASHFGLHPQAISATHRQMLTRACQVGRVPVADFERPPT